MPDDISDEHSLEMESDESHDLKIDVNFLLCMTIHMINFQVENLSKRYTVTIFIISHTT